MNKINLRNRYKSGDISKQDYIEEMFNMHQSIFDYSEFIESTDIAKIEISDKVTIFTSRTNGIKIACDINDKRFAPIEILNFEAYEPVESAMIMHLINSRSVVFDIGANIGWYSLNIAKVYPDSQIFAFEPIFKTFQSLEKNISINEITNIHCNNFGFSKESGKLKFYYYPNMSVSASAANLSGGNNFQEVISTVTTIDSFVEEKQLCVDFIKCDVEGAELFVFQGGIQSIERDKPIIFTEMLRKWSAKFNYHPNEIIELLTNIGYKCFVIKNEKLQELIALDEMTVETNFFFLHTAKHINEIKQHAII